MTSRSKLDKSLNSDSADRFAEIESAGIADAFERLGDAAPALLQLQSALLTGLSRTQLREAERLAAADQEGVDAAAARARAEKLERLRQTTVGIASGVAKLLDGESRQGQFHGFVLLEEGGAAVDYVVTIESRGSKGLKAKTDETGYFRIGLAVPSRGKGETPPVPVPPPAPEGLRKAAASEPDPATGANPEHSALITIVDPAKEIVLQEPVQLADGQGMANIRIFSVPARAAKDRRTR